MADLPILLSALLFVLVSDHAFCVITLSDYKICGDPECERPISRVQATKYHKGPDCRYLNFKRGDVIFVYYKLSGERDDLWAGAIDRKFGYFPKEAVDIEEMYTQEEIRTQTQEQDFFCIDDNGMITESELDNHANQNEDEGASENAEQHQKQSKSTKESPSTFEKKEFTEKGEDSQTLVQVNPDNAKQKSTEQGGSYWIGSQVTGWLGFGDQSDDGPQEKAGEQDSFKSRKLSLDIDGNQLRKEPLSEASGWLKEGLTNIFGFGQRNPEVNIEETNERDKLTDQNVDQSSMGTETVEEAGIAHEDGPVYASSWLNLGISDVLSFNKGHGVATGENRHPETSVDERLDIDNEIPASISQVGVDQEEKSKEAKEETSKREEKENTDIQPVSSHIDAENSEDYTSSIYEEKINENNNDKNNERTGWYSSVYNSISGFYNKKPEVENEEDITPKHSQGAVSHKSGSDEGKKGIQDAMGKGIKSMFSADGISSMFSRLTLRYQPDTPDVNKDVQHKESAAEMANEGREALLEAQTSVIDESIEGSGEENFDDMTDSIEQHPSIQLGVENTGNLYKTEPMSEQKQAIEEIKFENKNIDLQQNSSDYSVESESDHPDRGIGKLNHDIEIKQENTERNNLESTVQVLPPDTSENFTDQVIHHSGGAVGTESTGTPIQSASTQNLPEEKLSYVELTETSDVGKARKTSKSESEMECEEFKTPQSKDHSSENSQSPTAGHIIHKISGLVTDQIHPPSTTGASVHNQAEWPGFNEVDVQDSDTDETQAVEDMVETNVNTVISKDEDKTIATEEPLKRQEDKENIDIINAEVTVLKETLQGQSVPAKTVHVEGRKAISTTEKGKSTFTSIDCNVENYNEIVIGDLQLIPNEQNMQTNKEAIDATLDLPTQSSSDKSNEFYESQESKHRNKMPNNEAIVVNNDPGVRPAQDLEEIEKSSTLIQQDCGTRSKATSTSKDFSDFTQSDLNDLPGTIADGVLKQTEQQRDIHLKDIKSHDGIRYVEGNSEQIEHHNVKGDNDHQLLPCSHSQTETCINFVDGEKVYQTSAEQVKTKVPREILHTDQGEGFSNKTLESQDREGRLFLTVEGETVPQANNSVINYADSKTQAKTSAHKMNREQNYKINHKQIDEVNCKTTSEKVELLSEINDNAAKEPSDKNEGDVRDGKFISDKEVEVGTISDSTSYESNFPADESNTAYLVEDSHEVPMKTITKHMRDPLKEDMVIEETSQTKQYGDEMLLDSPTLYAEVQSESVHSIQEAIKARQIFKEYKNIQVHLNAEDVQYFLDVFGKNKLLWLDYCLGSTEIEDEVQNNDDNLAILSDFEQILKYHNEIFSTFAKSTQVDRNMNEEVLHDKNLSLKKLEILLSTLRSKYTMAKPAVSTNVIQDVGKPDCTTTNCFSAETNEHTRQGNTLQTGHTIEGAILSMETHTRSTKENHGVIEVNGAPLTFAGQLTFTTLETFSLIYSLLKWLITEVYLPASG